jgi:hypothetical protein
MGNGGILSDVDGLPIRTLGYRLQEFPSVLLARRDGERKSQRGCGMKQPDEVVTSTKDSTFQYDAPIVQDGCISETDSVRAKF